MQIKQITAWFTARIAECSAALDYLFNIDQAAEARIYIPISIQDQRPHQHHRHDS